VRAWALAAALPALALTSAPARAGTVATTPAVAQFTAASCDPPDQAASSAASSGCPPAASAATIANGRGRRRYAQKAWASGTRAPV
jgi:hypothetical protein